MGKLYVISTPIGNLGDISFRAIKTLKDVSIIFCEDTRVTRKLLSHYDIHTSISSYHSFSGFGKIKKAINFLHLGKDVALVSDAGTPTISDPGVKFVKAVRDSLHNIEIVSVPGPSAVVSALSISGAPSTNFTFLGFLPRKKGREKIFDQIKDSDITVVFYESPHRLIKTLTSLNEYFDSTKEIIIAREMTKIHEEIVSGTAEEVLNYFEENKDKVRGEIVIIVSSLKKIT